MEVALADGYHLIDTAEAYYNEDGVGQGIKNSGVNREDLFVSTKLWTTFYNDPDVVDKTINYLSYKLDHVEDHVMPFLEEKEYYELRRKKILDDNNKDE